MIFVSACTSSTGHRVAVSGNSVGQKQAQAIIGINKGNLPPDFTITTIDGRHLNIRNFKNENKPILLYFWASWCPYCSRDFDIVKSIYPKYADKVYFSGNRP
jgi:thiol-disulfide isomerase/thioredoxin